MKNAFLVKIEKPCLQDWAAMLPSEAGKYCMDCSQQVIDFTQMSDGEMEAIIKRSKGRLCGRFTNRQLNRPLILQKERHPWPQLPAFLAGLLFVSTLSKIQAQTPQTSTHVSQSSPTLADSLAKEKIPEVVPLKDSSMFVVEGTVLDSAYGEPLIGAHITVKGSSVWTSCDINGHFKLELVDNLLNPSHILLVKYIAYKDQEIEILSKSLPLIAPNELIIRLKEDDVHVLGGIVFQRPKWWQRLAPKAVAKRLYYKLF